jgi:hypothetical protein
LYCLWLCICTVSHTWQYISKVSWFMQYTTMYCYKPFSHFVLPLTLICTVSHTWQYISKESLFMQYKTMYCYSLLFLFPCLPLLWNIFFFPQTKKMGWCPDTFWCCPSLTGPKVYIMGSTQKKKKNASILGRFCSMGSTKMCLGSPFNRDPKSIMGSIKMCPFWVLLHGQHQNLSILSPVKWAASKCVHFGSFYMGSIKMCPFWVLSTGQHQNVYGQPI